MWNVQRLGGVYSPRPGYNYWSNFHNKLPNRLISGTSWEVKSPLLSNSKGLDRIQNSSRAIQTVQQKGQSTLNNFWGAGNIPRSLSKIQYSRMFSSKGDGDMYNKWDSKGSVGSEDVKDSSLLSFFWKKKNCACPKEKKPCPPKPDRCEKKKKNPCAKAKPPPVAPQPVKKPPEAKPPPPPRPPPTPTPRPAPTCCPPPPKCCCPPPCCPPPPPPCCPPPPSDCQKSKIRNRWISLVGKLCKRKDPKKFVSAKTGRGPFAGNWHEHVQPIMTCYKLVTIEIKLWAFQSRVENFVANYQKKIFTNFHQDLVCGMDDWLGLTMAEIRVFEERTKRELDEKKAAAAACKRPGSGRRRSKNVQKKQNT